MVKTHFITILKEMSKDQIPNIRMNVSKAAIKIRESLYTPEGQAAAGALGPAVDNELS